MPSPRDVFSGLKLLLVEDNFLVAEHMRDMLMGHGCDVIGPAARVTSALQMLAQSEALDGALLDVNLHGELCFPIAHALAARGVPFLFLTGYEPGSIIPKEFATASIVPKPVDEGRLLAMIHEHFLLFR
jgi:CheY-like chemotaxis protein